MIRGGLSLTVDAEGAHELRVVGRPGGHAVSGASRGARQQADPAGRSHNPTAEECRSACAVHAEPKGIRQQQDRVEAAVPQSLRPRPAARRPGPRCWPTPVSSSNIGAIDGSAATARRRRGNAARTATTAGSAITASPSQFGMRTTMRAGARLSAFIDLVHRLPFVRHGILPGGAREHPSHLFADRNVAPSAMHPEPLFRIAANVHLEHVGAALRELADRVGAVGRRVASPGARRPCGIGRQGAAARKPGRPEPRSSARAPPALTWWPPDD